MTQAHSNDGQGGQHGHGEDNDKDEQEDDREPIVIFISEERIVAPSKRMTGEQLRNLPHPPVPANRDLWLEVPGAGDDVLIRPETTYKIKRGSRYYTAPSTINPGSR